MIMSDLDVASSLRTVMRDIAEAAGLSPDEFRSRFGYLVDTRASPSA